MPNSFYSLVVPATDGVGAAQDVSTVGAIKDIIVTGTFSATLTIEISENGTDWASAASFTGPESQKVNAQCNFVRVRRAGTEVGAPNAVVCTIGGPNATVFPFPLAVPAGNGVGASANVSAIGRLKTVIVGGNLVGGINIDVSQDGGVSWFPFLTFTNPGRYDIMEVAAQLVRVRVSGYEGGTGVVSLIGSGTDDILALAAAFVFRPGGVQGGNVFTDWADLVAAMQVVQGLKILQFDDTIVSPCVVPIGTWDMSNVEWFALNRPGTATPTSVSIVDGAHLTNLQKVTGELNITNLNTVTAAIVLPAGNYLFELGQGVGGDFPAIICTGTAGFINGSALMAGQQVAVNVFGNIIGASLFIQMGASPARPVFLLSDRAALAADKVAGTDVTAQLRILRFGSNIVVGPQAGWAGIVSRGVGFGGTGPADQLFGSTPAPVTITRPPAPGAASTVAFTAATGLGHNTTHRLNATAGSITQPLPAVAQAAMNTHGMFLVMDEVSAPRSHGNFITITPAGADTLGGGTTGIRLSAGAGVLLQSDGVSNWIVIAIYYNVDGYVPNEMWFFDDLAAGAVSVALGTRISALFETWQTICGGSIVGLITRLNDTITAGTLTIDVRINGVVALSLIHTAGSNPTGGRVIQAAGVDNYVAGDLIDIVYTTDAGFLPAGSADIECSIEITDH